MSEAGEYKHPMDGIDAILVARNNLSTRSQLCDKLIQRLENEIPNKRIEAVRINPGEIAKSRQRLIRALKASPPGRSLIIIAGGDGTAHFIAAALLHDEMPDIYRHTPITPWPLGNGNDFFNSVHGPEITKDPLQILHSPRTHAIHVHPLEWRIQNPSGETRRYSVCYGTIGATGSATQYINQPEHRARRKQASGWVSSLILDMRQGARALWFPRRFTLCSEDGSSKPATELQFNNGPIMALSARYPILLSQPGMFVSVSRSRHPLAIAALALQMRLGTVRGKYYNGAIKYSIKSRHAVHAQTDGEPFTINKNTSFCVQPCQSYLVIWATKKA